MNKSAKELGATVQTSDLERTYRFGNQVIHAVNGVNLDIYPGEFVTLQGRSGSGKTTLLNLVAGLESPSAGRVIFQGNDFSELSESNLTEIRRTKIGFVFQSFGLLPLLSAYENVELPLRLAGVNRKERDARTREYLEMVGLTGRSHHRPYELSGGEQQRVAIARAIVHNPPLVLADEPTGELDSDTANVIFSLLRGIAGEQNIAVLATTHDPTLLSMATRTLEMSDGKFSELSEDGSQKIG